MYFLAKNIRSYTRFRAPDKLKLYPDGALNVDYLWRNISYFIVHPEQIRQKLKERDAHMLCQFLDSDEYKNRVTKFLETQDKILSKDIPTSSTTSPSTPSNPIKYQHVLSCAQPSHRRPKAIDDIEGVQLQNEVVKKRKIRKGTVIEQMLKKKGTIVNDDNISIRSEKPKQIRQIRSTIMPIFLKKIRERRQEEEQYVKEQTEEPEQIEPIDFNNQTARRLKSENDDSLEPLYAKILHKSNLFRKAKSLDRHVSTPSLKSKDAYEPYHVVKPRTAAVERNRMDLPLNYSPLPLKPRVSQHFVHVQTNPLPKVKTHFMVEKVDARPEPKISHNAIVTTRSKLDHSPYRLNKIFTNPEEYSMRPQVSSSVMPMRMMATSKCTNKAPLVKLLPKKSMNLKSFSDLLCTEPFKQSKNKLDRNKSRYKNKVADGEMEIKVVKTKANKEPVKKTKISMINISRDDEKAQLLVNKVQQGRSLKSLKLDTCFENESTMERVKQMKEVNRAKNMKMSSLFQKVKLGSSKAPAEDLEVEDVLSSVAKPNKMSKLDRTILRGKKERDAKLVLEVAPEPQIPKQSFTYKIVSRKRVEQEEKLREIFNKKSVSLRGGSAKKKSKGTSNNSEKENVINMDKLNKNRVINLEESQKVVSRNIPRTLHRPVPHFVEHASKPNGIQVNQFHGKISLNHPDITNGRETKTRIRENKTVKNLLFLRNMSNIRYLMRLPKSTPEGYRVLLYSVRDPDPTKMNFNDVVKGFCMYNDCVLSEDGLQEGYIVIFDMKDVCIGHLARVSLPALKCFMYYIQDAHPCRLKQIHVLNTASWIQHVMRLVVPLVRSELLNLVKFHKGNVPDNFPIELLPMDYGGEAPNVEDLDNSTKSLLGKYRDWLVESEQLKSDESKRVKKASWWGLFSSKTPQQVELDEKTILKNLQID